MGAEERYCQRRDDPALRYNDEYYIQAVVGALIYSTEMPLMSVSELRRSTANSCFFMASYSPDIPIEHVWTDWSGSRSRSRSQ
ncbi:hypothetical protein TNCV_4884691 [Trichonephila clavipes]|nr:hypothetical protein TNCV_4884691 [Trichonephila clavipes]